MKKKNNALRIFVLSLLSLIATGCAESAGSKLIGQPVPYTRVTLLDNGSIVPITQFTDTKKPLVLAFWATTCNFSPRRVQAVDRMAKNLKPAGVQFVAVSIDRAKDLEQLRSVIKKRKLENFTHAFSGNDVYDEAYIAFKGSELPYFVVIDENGTIVASGDSTSVVEDYFEEHK